MKKVYTFDFDKNIYFRLSHCQVVRALTIIWSLLMQCYYFPEFVVGRWRVVACLVVIVGFCIGSYGEINFNWIGAIFCAA